MEAIEKVAMTHPSVSSLSSPYSETQILPVRGISSLETKVDECSGDFATVIKTVQRIGSSAAPKYKGN
jgi:hypothetical protein